MLTNAFMKKASVVKVDFVLTHPVDMTVSVKMDTFSLNMVLVKVG